MKKTILVSLIVCVAFVYNVHAQAKSSESNVVTGNAVKSTGIVAPAQQIQKPCSGSATIQTGTGTKNLQPVSVATDNGFPVYVNTGNDEQDMENYRIAKDAWIEQNPEKYLEMQGLNSKKDQ